MSNIKHIKHLPFTRLKHFADIITQLAFSNLPHSKVHVEERSNWQIHEFPIASAPKNKVKYCFCTLLLAIWEITWLSFSSILDGR